MVETKENFNILCGYYTLSLSFPFFAHTTYYIYIHNNTQYENLIISPGIFRHDQSSGICTLPQITPVSISPSSSRLTYVTGKLLLYSITKTHSNLDGTQFQSIVITSALELGTTYRQPLINGIQILQIGSTPCRQDLNFWRMFSQPEFTATVDRIQTFVESSHNWD